MPHDDPRTAAATLRARQSGQALRGFLFDAAELARGAVLFTGLVGGIVLVLLALLERS